MSVNWTLDDLATIEVAIASGVLKIEYGDGRKAHYRSMSDLKIARTLIKRALGLQKRHVRILTEPKKGIV